MVKKTRTFPDRQTYEIPGGFDSTIGIVSFGAIGKKVCKYLSCMCESDILVCDLLLTSEDASRFGLHKSSLEEVFQQSDVISLHTPMPDTTIGMIDKRILNLMKTNSVLINTARGAIINENDLINFLRHRQDVYAILDVTEPEPPTADSVLYDMENVLLSPYIAGFMGRECKRLGRYMVEELQRYVLGMELHWQVNREHLAFST